MIARSAYFTGTPLWKGTIVDELAGMYNKETHELESDPDSINPSEAIPNIAPDDEKYES